MKKPEMIIFDYGHTLAYDPDWDALRGEEALLKHAVCIPEGCTMARIRQEISEAYALVDELRKKAGCDIPCVTANRLAYERLGIQFSLSPLDQEIVFWTAASPGRQMPDTDHMLDSLKDMGIRTAVLSNNGWSSEALRQRLERLFPRHRFEFVMSSCDYLVRKPDIRLFEIALRKSQCSADQVWYCGDSIKADLYGAHAAGIFPVYYVCEVTDGRSNDHKNEGLTIPFDHLRISSWAELTQAVSTL